MQPFLLDPRDTRGITEDTPNRLIDSCNAENRNHTVPDANDAQESSHTRVASS